MTITFVPHRLTSLLKEAGLTIGQRHAVIYALTLAMDDRYCLYLDTAYIAVLAGVDRETVSIAKAKLDAACLISLVQPRREVSPGKWTPELWDFSALVELITPHYKQPASQEVAGVSN